jgi:hypothetical protein
VYVETQTRSPRPREDDVAAEAELVLRRVDRVCDRQVLRR